MSLVFTQLCISGTEEGPLHSSHMDMYVSWNVFLLQAAAWTSCTSCQD